MGLGIPPLEFKILLESNPLKSGILLRRLAVLENRHATGSNSSKAICMTNICIIIIPIIHISNNNNNNNNIIIIMIPIIDITMISSKAAEPEAAPRWSCTAGSNRRPVDYLSNATCLMRPHLLYVFFVVSRIVTICYNIHHVCFMRFSQCQGPP